MMGKLRMTGLVISAAAFFVLAGQGLTSAATARGTTASGPDAGKPPGMSAKDPTKDAGSGAIGTERDSGARLLSTTDRDSGTNP
jgi:hypothetical protein